MMIFNRFDVLHCILKCQESMPNCQEVFNANQPGAGNQKLAIFVFVPTQGLTGALRRILSNVRYRSRVCRARRLARPVGMNDAPTTDGLLLQDNAGRLLEQCRISICWMRGRRRTWRGCPTLNWKMEKEWRKGSTPYARLAIFLLLYV
jgi:hypothetical protein